MQVLKLIWIILSMIFETEVTLLETRKHDASVKNNIFRYISFAAVNI